MRNLEFEIIEDEMKKIIPFKGEFKVNYDKKLDEWSLKVGAATLSEKEVAMFVVAHYFKDKDLKLEVDNCEEDDKLVFMIAQKL